MEWLVLLWYILRIGEVHNKIHHSGNTAEHGFASTLTVNIARSPLHFLECTVESKVRIYIYRGSKLPRGNSIFISSCQILSTNKIDYAVGEKVYKGKIDKNMHSVAEAAFFPLSNKPPVLHSQKLPPSILVSQLLSLRVFTHSILLTF